MTPQQIEAMKLALEALKKCHYYMIDAGLPNQSLLNKAFTAYKALEKALAQPEQEPVAFEEWLSKQHGDPEEIGFLQALRIAYISGQDSITTPPQRTWVGLTDEQIDRIWIPHTIIHAPDRQHQAFARAIEAAVWEKQK